MVELIPTLPSAKIVILGFPFVANFNGVLELDPNHNWLASIPSSALILPVVRLNLSADDVPSSTSNTLPNPASDAGTLVPIPTDPIPVTRNLSSPLVCKVIVSLAGNLIFVFESPVWYIVSLISKLPPTVASPVTDASLLTVRSLVTVRLLPIVTLSGSPILIFWLDARVSI